MSHINLALQSTAAVTLHSVKAVTFSDPALANCYLRPANK